MNLSDIERHDGCWLGGTGPQDEVVVSSRVRLARNLAGHLFVNKCQRRHLAEINQRCRETIEQAQLAPQVLWIDMTQTCDVDRQLLVERHLVSRQHAQGRPDQARGAAISSDESFAIMVNEEDHLRIQVLRSGLQLEQALAQINRLDDALEERLDYAYDSRWGYLTACPTNLGTGIRVSVMVHLPALRMTGEIEKVRRAAKDLHLAVRGLFGEGSEAMGDLFQVSNQTTLGKSEDEILDEFSRSIVPQIVAYEQQARQALLNQRPTQLDDKVWRAWGLLTQARLLGTEEVLSQLSLLRLGVHLGRIDCVDLTTINQLLLVTQPAHLQKLTGCQPDQPARRRARADLVRCRLAAPTPPCSFSPPSPPAAPPSTPPAPPSDLPIT